MNKEEAAKLDDYTDLDQMLRDFHRGLGIVEGLQIAQEIIKASNDDGGNDE